MADVWHFFLLSCSTKKLCKICYILPICLLIICDLFNCIIIALMWLRCGPHPVWTLSALVAELIIKDMQGVTYIELKCTQIRKRGLIGLIYLTVLLLRIDRLSNIQKPKPQISQIYISHISYSSLKSPIYLEYPKWYG